MKLLHISASPRHDISHSRKVGQMLVDRLCSATPFRITRRDLARTPPPYPNADFAAASVCPDARRNDGHRRALGTSERLIAELEGADAVVVDTPMHNFTVPATLKAWIDLVVRPGRTFQSTPNGKVGLLPDRPTILVVASGGPVGPAPSGQQDFLTPYVRYLLATIGIRDLEVVTMDCLARGADAVERAEADAIAKLDGICSRVLSALDRKTQACSELRVNR
jgi:FMN-dependent NADH-azoreductase